VAQRVAADATAEPTEAGAVFRRDDLFSRACVTIFRRFVAQEGFARRRTPGQREAEYFPTCSSVLQKGK
jgi:hypothetical protein